MLSQDLRAMAETLRENPASAPLVAHGLFILVLEIEAMERAAVPVHLRRPEGAAPIHVVWSRPACPPL